MDETDELKWVHKAVDIRDRRTFRRLANDAECAVVTSIFSDARCLALSADYEVVPLAPGRYRVAGTVSASIEQICGVTLDPLEQRLSETFEVEFRAGLGGGRYQDPDFDALEEDDPEPIEHGEMRVGRFLCEIVASAIDPFPRAEDAELERSEAVGQGKEQRKNPFAALAVLREKQDRG